jgi:hypothetical protein
LYIYGGNTNISLGVRPIGEYNLTVELWNNTYYESSTATATFRVEKYDVNLTIAADDIMLGENATIIINSTPNDFKGKAILEINGYNQSVYISDGQTNVTLSDLSYGKYDLKLYYDGDAKFKNSTAYSSFNVLRTPVALEISIEDGFILVKTNYTDCEGLVSLYVNNNFYTQNLSNAIVHFTVDFSEGANNTFNNKSIIYTKYPYKLYIANSRLVVENELDFSLVTNDVNCESLIYIVNSTTIWESDGKLLKSDSLTWDGTLKHDIKIAASICRIHQNTWGTFTKPYIDGCICFVPNANCHNILIKDGVVSNMKIDGSI